MTRWYLWRGLAYSLEVLLKIKSVSVDVLRTPLAEPYAAGGHRVDANWQVLSRVGTDQGLSGFGYVVQPRGELIPAIASATRELGGWLIGLRADEPEAAWEYLSQRAGWVGPGGLLHWALASLDIALWDLAGRAAGQPLYRLLGGAGDRIAAYASDRLWYSLSPEELQESVRSHARRGFRGAKLRLGHTDPPEELAERVALAVEAGGRNIDIMVDATEGWDERRALAAGRAIAEAGGKWLEDPLHHTDLAGLRRLRRRLDLPVTGGEHYYTLGQFRECLEREALDVVILDLARVGGITPWRKIAALAESHRVPVCGHVVPEVHAHLLAATSNSLQVEYMPRSNEILASHPEPVDGVIKLSDSPGHGLVLDEQAVAQYRQAC